MSENDLDCKKYINLFNKKINSVLYKGNFDKNGQICIPIKGECFDQIYDFMSNSGLNPYFKKNHRAIEDSMPNCVKIFLNNNKLYFVDWLCEDKYDHNK